MWKQLLPVPSPAATIIVTVPCNDLEKVESFQLFSIFPAFSAMKLYMETGCLRQPPANHCLPLFYHSLSSFYPLVTGIVTGILRHISHDGCGTMFTHLNHLSPATLRYLPGWGGGVTTMQARDVPFVLGCLFQKENNF